MEVLEGNETEAIEEKRNFKKDLHNLLLDGRFSDVVLVVGGKEFKAHKNILAARSPVFAAMFDNEWKESQQNSRVEINEMDPEVFGDLILFLYTDQILSLDRHVSELLIAADKVVALFVQILHFIYIFF